MAKQRPRRLIPGALSLTLALVAFILGSAPFTPALALLLLALPLAILSVFMGAWRLTLVSVYFSVAICAVIFLAGQTPFRIDHLLLLLGIVGIVLGGTLLYFYRRTLAIT